MPAADLSKALDPAIWPLRVKVREYIYYSNKNKNSQPRKDASKDVVSETVATLPATDAVETPQ